MYSACIHVTIHGPLSWRILMEKSHSLPLGSTNRFFFFFLSFFFFKGVEWWEREQSVILVGHKTGEMPSGDSRYQSMKQAPTFVGFYSLKSPFGHSWLNQVYDWTSRKKDERSTSIPFAFHSCSMFKQIITKH